MQNLKYQIKYINPELLSWAEEEIDRLPDLLMEDEEIIHIVDGLYEGTAVLLLSTNNRLIFKTLGTDSVDVIPHENIVSLQFLEVQNTIEINTQEKIFKLEKTESRYAVQFCEAVNSLLGKNIQDSTSVFELLEKLGKLRENGILTEEEFTSQKKKLLEKL